MMRRNVESRLTPWIESDGEFIHVAALLKALPGHRWDMRLIGMNANGRPGKTLPLLGKTRMGAVVVLLSSLREWLLHYNAGAFALVDSMVEDLRREQQRYIAKLKAIRVENSVNYEKRGPKPKPPTKKIKKLSVTSHDVFGAWK